MVIDSSQIYLSGYNGGDAKAWWVDFDASSNNFIHFSAIGSHIYFAQTMALKQYGFFGAGIQFDSITAVNDISLGGYTSCNYLKTYQSTYFVDAQFSVNDLYLYLAPDGEHFFNSNNLVNNDYLEVGVFNTPTNCEDFVTLKGFAKSKGGDAKKHLAS